MTAWRRLYRPAWLLPAVGLVVTLACARTGLPLRVANDMEALLAGNPAFDVYREFVSRLGSDESVIVFWPVAGLAREELVRLHELRGAILDLPRVIGTACVLDLVPPEALRSSADLSSWCGRPRSLPRLQEMLDRSRLARGRLVSRDGRWLVLSIGLDLPETGGVEAQRSRTEAVDRIEAAARRILAGRPFHLLGYPVVDRRVLELIRQSNTVLLPLAILAGALVLWLTFRILRVVAIAMTAIGSALLWTVAAFRIRDYTLNPFSTMLLPLVLTIGVTTTIYVLTAWIARARRRSQDPLAQSLPEVLPPTLLATTTTAIGFASLAWVDVPEIRNFGIYDALGTLFCLLAVLVYVPGMLEMSGSARSLATPSRRRRDRIGIVLARMVRVLTGRPYAVLISVALLAALAGAGICRLEVESTSLGGLAWGDPVAVANRTCREVLEPPVAVELLLTRSAGARIADFEGIRALMGLGRALERFEGVISAISAADIALDGASYIAKRRREDIASGRELELTLRLLDDERTRRLLDRFVTRDGRLGRVRVVIEPEGSLAMLTLTDRILGKARSALGPGWEVRATGRYLLSAKTHQGTLANERTSFLLSLSTIVILITLVFRSVALGLMAALPNVFPMVMGYATMGFLGIPLDVMGGMIPCILIGMVVDDTIHWLFRYRKARLTLGPRLAVQRTVLQIGRAVVTTAATLSVGMLVMTLSPFAMISRFGFFMALTVVFGVLVELTLTPVLLVLFPRLLEPAPGRTPCGATTPSRPASQPSVR